MVLRKKAKIKEDLEEWNFTEGWNLVLQVTQGEKVQKGAWHRQTVLIYFMTVAANESNMDFRKEIQKK